MAQHGPHARCKADIGRVREQPGAQPHGQAGLADVVEGGEHARAPAHEHHGVGGPQIAGATVPDVYVIELAQV